MLITTILLPFITSLLVTAVATPLMIPLIKKWGLIDDPAIHQHPAMVHKKPIPRAGGIPLFLGVFLGALFLLPFTKTIIALFIASALALFVGTLDDKYDISPYIRIGINILCAIIAVGGGVGLPYITNPFGGILHLDTLRISFMFFGRHSILILSDFLAMIWIIWVMNMLNWSKGVDGQMPGVVSISAFVIGLLSLRIADPTTTTAATLAFLIAGASAGFLFYNYHPARIFPGYGATAIYLLLSVTAILSGAKLATAILVMGVPLVDGTVTIIRRLISGKSPFWHDKKHLHHLLLALGLGHRPIAIIYWIFSGLLGWIALSLSSTGKAFAIIMLIVISGGGILFLHILTKHEA